jgi:putative ATP-dependent endonuclease of OLD family
MRITSLRIQNFRCIKDLEIQLGETTVFIGQNSSGKTAILDAIRIALTRRWGQRGTGFTEYDVHLENDKADHRTAPGVEITVRSEEQRPGEWPDEVVQGLDHIKQVDAITGINSITLLVTWKWNRTDSAFEPGWVFLNAARQPLLGPSVRRTNLEQFWKYLPVFYLGALRDAEDEFSQRSQFWGRLLKAMEIPPQLEVKVQKVLQRLNSRLLRADPRLTQIADTLSSVSKVAARDRDGSVDLQALPMKAWDLLARAEIIMKNAPDHPWLPLQKHGQGVQSLSVIFLFEAFVKHLLSELYEEDSTAVLALEEPETHLHPQAARSLWSHVSTLTGQKIISTHSPYFVQHVPFRDLRVVCLTDKGTEVRWLPPSFSERVPHVPELDTVITAFPELSYDRPTGRLTVAGAMTEDARRRLMTCYGQHQDRAVIATVITQLRERSKLFISDAELRQLGTWAGRIRGEIFFARRWLIVEGQSEYLLIHALARQLGYDLDEHGVAVIDAVNNGNPAVFAALARALQIPWVALLDGDTAGLGYVSSIASRDFDPTVVAERCRVLSAGTLEQQLLADGLEPELRAIASTWQNTAAMTLPQLRKCLEHHKIGVAAALADRIAADAAFAARMPQVFRDGIFALRGFTA